jgi:ketosteroid isomerase-like protein
MRKTALDKIFAPLLAAFVVASCAAPPREISVSADPVIAAERAFAARAGEAGARQAFLEFTAPDGQVPRPVVGLVATAESIAGAPDRGNRNLFWSPLYAGIARSGDLGFTTGIVSFDATRTPRIQYFTVWRRQADGTWKWIYDGGPGAVSDVGAFLPEGEEPPTLPLAVDGVGSSSAAVAQVSAIEAQANTAVALTAYLSEHAHVYRAQRPRAYGGAESASTMTYPSGAVTYRVLRVEGSEAGDLAFTVGWADWTSGDRHVQGMFARIWQYRPAGWRIVYDQLLEPPPSAN